MNDESWKEEWAAVQACVGQVFGADAQRSALTIDASAVWRYLEPLEFDCPLHYDAHRALAAGYAGIVVPATAIAALCLPPLWSPGQPLYDQAERNAQPAAPSLAGWRTGKEPPTQGFFAADYEADFWVDVIVGDTLCRTGARLLSCEPKRTRVGRGAFLKWESGVVNQHDVLVMTQRMTYFRYHPEPAA